MGPGARCGASAGTAGHAPALEAPAGGRVCNRCGLGLLLQAAETVAPTPVDPFLVVDSRLVSVLVSST